MNTDSIEIPEDFVFVGVDTKQLSLAKPLRRDSISRVSINTSCAFAHPKNPVTNKFGVGVKILKGSPDPYLRWDFAIFDVGSPEFDHLMKLAFIEQVMK